MTDTTELAPQSVEEPGPEIRTCAVEGCENTFVVSTTGFGAKRKFCEDHIKRKEPASKKTRRDRRPSNVNVKFQAGTSKKTDELAQVKAAITQYGTMATGVLLIFGLEADAQVVAECTPELAECCRNLAEYEDWLRKLLSGGPTEQVSRVMAWVALLLAVLKMGGKIAANHDAVPARLVPLLDSLTADDPAGVEAA